MANWVLEAGLILLLLYTLLPFLMSRILGLGVFRSDQAGGTIALTFDDGPHPVYTPFVLDMLRAYGVKATFFVVGSQAELYPELIQRIHREGHAIGLHGYKHHPHWTKTPWSIKREAEHTAQLIERLTGVRPVLYRPPWGLFNLLDYIVLRNFRLVLWSCIVGDWRKQEPERMWQRLQRRIRPGSIIVLHDSDFTFGAERGAPLVMLDSLHKLLQASSKQTYRWARVDEMEKKKRHVGTRLWLLWEQAFQRLFRVQPVRSANDFLLVRPRRYTGKQPIQLDDGTVIEPGDPLIEIHLNNHYLLHLHRQANSDIQLAKLLLQETRQMLEVLAAYLDHPERESVKALYGISLINRGVRSLGFTTLSMSNGFFFTATKWYLRLLLGTLHPQGRSRLQKRRELLNPQQIVLSRRTLLSRYLKRESAPILYPVYHEWEEDEAPNVIPTR